MWLLSWLLSIFLGHFLLIWALVCSLLVALSKINLSANIGCKTCNRGSDWNTEYITLWICALCVSWRLCIVQALPPAAVNQYDYFPAQCCNRTLHSTFIQSTTTVEDDLIVYSVWSVHVWCPSNFLHLLVKYLSVTKGQLSGIMYLYPTFVTMVAVDYSSSVMWECSNCMLNSVGPFCLFPCLCFKKICVCWGICSVSWCRAVKVSLCEFYGCMCSLCCSSLFPSCPFQLCPGVLHLGSPLRCSPPGRVYKFLRQHREGEMPLSLFSCFIET